MQILTDACLALLAALALPAMALQADDWALPELEKKLRYGPWCPRGATETAWSRP